MMDKNQLKPRYFVTYTGVKLPLKLLNELTPEGLDKRITYFAGYYDESDRLSILEKVVYGEIEFSHHYYHNQENKLVKAVLYEGDSEPRTMVFNSNGMARET